jgi:hypothetical protein
MMITLKHEGPHFRTCSPNALLVFARHPEVQARPSCTNCADRSQQAQNTQLRKILDPDFTKVAGAARLRHQASVAAKSCLPRCTDLPANPLMPPLKMTSITLVKFIGFSHFPHQSSQRRHQRPIRPGPPASRYLQSPQWSSSGSRRPFAAPPTSTTSHPGAASSQHPSRSSRRCREQPSWPQPQ